MRTIDTSFTDVKEKAIICAITLLAWVFMFSMAARESAAAETTKDTRSPAAVTSGSGDRYQTIVRQHTDGKLSMEDLHQASLLTSRIVNHLNEARNSLLDQKSKEAELEMKKAQKLTKIVKDLIPVTTVTTVVKNAEGKEVYRDVDRVQDDDIALYEGMVSMEIVDPVIDAKKEKAKINGLRLEDADIVHTSIVADLSYIERKLNRAMALLNNPDDALEQLTLAQTEGIKLIMNESDNPLVKAQDALDMAKKMVQEGQYKAARDNLNIARVQLGIYREVMDKDTSREVKRLEDDISALMPKTAEKGVVDEIRGVWARVIDLFHKSVGQAHVVNSQAKKEAHGS